VVYISICIKEHQASAFAQFLEQLVLDDVRRCSESAEQAFAIIYAVESLREALAVKGFGLDSERVPDHDHLPTE
jgi:hypothetical protein